MAFAIEMHVTMSARQEDPGTMDLMPLGNLFAAASLGWCVQALNHTLHAEMQIGKEWTCSPPAPYLQAESTHAENCMFMQRLVCLGIHCPHVQLLYNHALVLMI